MEGAPTTIDFTPEGEKPERKKTKRTAGSGEALTLPSVEGVRQGAADQHPPAREGLMRRLIGAESAKVDTKKEAAGEPTLETLSPEEAHFVVSELVRADQATEVERPPATDAEAVAVEGAIDQFRARILEAQETPEQALAETLEDLGIDSPAEVPEFSDNAPAGTESVVPADSNESDFWTQQPPRAASKGILPLLPVEERPQAITAEHDNQEPDDDFTITGYTPDNNSQAASSVPRHFEAQRDSVAGLPWPEATRDRRDHSDITGAALVGGMVSYLVGRRRGRLKTEKRLLPIQHKLEKQVKSLQRDLNHKETIIRQAVAERTERQLAEAYPGRPVAAREQPPRHKRPEREVAAPARQPEKTRLGQFLLTAAETVPTTISRSVTPESRPRGKVKNLETSATEPLKAAAKEVSVERAAAQPLDKHVETLSRNDLLELSSKIIVESTSLRQVYESRQIGEKALRRIVSEHLRGGDVRKALRAEITQHEIDFERDPILRDQAHQAQHDQIAGGKTLEALLQRADASLGRQSDAGRAANETQSSHQPQEQASREHQQRLVTMSLTSIIVVLSVIVIVLLMTR